MRFAWLPMVYPNFIKISKLVQKLKEGTHPYRQHGYLTSQCSFLMEGKQAKKRNVNEEGG
jgi:hypothetical protein